MLFVAKPGPDSRYRPTAALLQQRRRRGICDREDELAPSRLWARASIVPARSISPRNGQGPGKRAKEGRQISGSGCAGVHIPTVAAREMPWISAYFQQVWTLCSPTQAGYQYTTHGRSIPSAASTMATSTLWNGISARGPRQHAARCEASAARLPAHGQGHQRAQVSDAREIRLL